VDFKSTCILISFLALGAGIVKGWSDAEKNKRRPGPAVTIDTSPGPGEITEPAHPEELPETTEPAERGEPGAAPRQPPAITLKPIDLAISASAEARLGEISSSIEKHRLPDAARAAREMVQNSDGMEREKARQLEARILLLQKMEPRDAGKAPALKEVVQSNKSVLVCTSVEKRSGSYKLKLISGGVTTVAEDRVKEVRDIDPKEGRRILLSRISKRVANLEDPLDFYLRGVRKYYRLGLADEGYVLLTQLLDRNDADLALSVLGEEEAESLLPYWNLANGSGIAALERKAEARAEEIAATPPAHLVASGEPPSQPGGSQAAARPPARKPPPRRPPARPAAQATPADSSAMAEVRQLISKANAYYTNARRDEKKRGDFKKAYETLRSAQDKLSRMASTDEVRKTRARVATSMLDVSKSLGFFDF
jgi:hypothetical protein